MVIKKFTIRLWKYDFYCKFVLNKCKTIIITQLKFFMYNHYIYCSVIDANNNSSKIIALCSLYNKINIIN